MLSTLRRFAHGATLVEATINPLNQEQLFERFLYKLLFTTRYYSKIDWFTVASILSQSVSNVPS
jgi:hypothetical protein